MSEEDFNYIFDMFLHFSTVKQQKANTINNAMSTMGKLSVRSRSVCSSGMITFGTNLVLFPEVDINTVQL